MAARQANWLAIDAGNTRVKWGLHDGDLWTARGAVATADAERIDEDWPELASGTNAIASNVAGDAVADRLRRACDRRGVPITFIKSAAKQLGVVSGYRDPAQLGTDRWAGLIAAHKLSAANQVVVNAGTALTIDALSATGRFLGGLIVPGPALMRRSLNQGTAALRDTEGEFRAFPASTAEAIGTGAVQAGVGAIERMAEVMADEGVSPVRVVLSGGAATLLAPHLPLPVTLNENLVLDGLLHIARAA